PAISSPPPASSSRPPPPPSPSSPAAAVPSPESLGFFVGAITGALIGLATESGLFRGAGIGAISGAVFSIDVVESSLRIWSSRGSGIWSILYVIEIIASFLSGRLVREKVGHPPRAPAGNRTGAPEAAQLPDRVEADQGDQQREAQGVGDRRLPGQAGVTDGEEAIRLGGAAGEGRGDRGGAGEGAGEAARGIGRSSSSYFFAVNVAQNPGEPPSPFGLAHLRLPLLRPSSFPTREKDLKKKSDIAITFF
ncbi:hypothetical protein Taro_019981, partial [Colocasia esculenta]|nr:hypothetical protein [Colocasia esculenta]